MRKAGWLIGGFVLLTTGCGAAETSFEPNVFSEKDDYGNLSYEGGIQLFYRKDEVAAIRLTEESEGRYQTARGAKVGMPQNEMVKLYGDQYMDSPGSGFLDYFYDSENDKLLTDPTQDLPPGSPEDAEKIHLVSTKLDADEHAESILILDRRWAVYMD